MANRSSIQFLSGVLDTHSTLTEEERSNLALFRQTYPYFVPVRYIEAQELHKNDPFAKDMLSAMQPYMGNWILFRDFMDGIYTNNRAYQAEEETMTDNAQHTEEPVLPVSNITETTKVINVNAEELTAASEISMVAEQEDAMPDETEPVQSEEMHSAEDEPVQETTVYDAPGTEETPAESETVVMEETPAEEPMNTNADAATEEELIQPIYTSDYFLQQGMKVAEEIPGEIEELKTKQETEDPAKSLMVMMSFSEWLLHFKNSAEKQKEENEDQRALKSMWQKEKLAAAIEEENEEIPENVFEMAVNSITKEDGLASESLADIYIKQGKFDKAVEMYRKLSLRNPQKNAYFARKIEEILKDR